MNRRKAICYLIIGIAVGLLVLFCLAMISVWIMLVTLLLLVLAVGILTQKNPELLAALRSSPGSGKAPKDGSGTAAAGSDPFQPRVVLVGMHTGTLEQIIIDKPVFTFGRNPACDYTPSNISYVSDVHATFYLDQEKSQILIQDNNSQNGTFVNNLRLTPGIRFPLSEGDIIQLGTMRFRSEFAHF